MRASILTARLPGAPLTDVIALSGISLLALTISAIVVSVVVPAVWSRNQDRRHAAQAVLRDILHAISRHSRDHYEMAAQKHSGKLRRKPVRGAKR